MPDWLALRRARAVVYILLHAIIVLTGTVLSMAGGAVLVAIGTGLIATGVSGWIVFAYVHLSERRSRTYDVINEFGFVDAFAARSSAIKGEYDKRLVAAAEVDILGFGLRAFREDYQHQLEPWLRRGMRVRVLLLDPKFPYGGTPLSGLRDDEEHNAVGSIATDVEMFLTATAGLRAGFPEAFAVRLYRALPAINILRADDELFWGPYLMGQQSRSAPTFIVARGGALYELLSAHFDAIWNSDKWSKRVDADQL